MTGGVNFAVITLTHILFTDWAQLLIKEGLEIQHNRSSRYDVVKWTRYFIRRTVRTWMQTLARWQLLKQQAEETVFSNNWPSLKDKNCRPTRGLTVHRLTGKLNYSAVYHCQGVFIITSCMDDMKWYFNLKLRAVWIDIWWWLLMGASCCYCAWVSLWGMPVICYKCYGDI